ncbi:MAG: hypothetical protein KBB21_06680 [Nannocystaceae bacterium]|nr:hypothetical protein [Nannocystaceae bacterium]
MTFVPTFGSPFDHAININVNAVNDSSYEHPLVMACCSDQPEDVANTCAMEIHRACYVDLLMQACKAVGPLIQTHSSDQGIGTGAGVMNVAGKDIKQDLVQHCFDSLWYADDSEHPTCQSGGLCENEDFCGAQFGPAFHHPKWKVPRMYSLLGMGLRDIEFSLVSNVQPVAFDPLPEEGVVACFSGQGNDGDLPTGATPGDGGGLVSPLVDAPATLVGPLWQGEVIYAAGEFSEASSLTYTFVSATELSIAEWAMVEAAPITAGTSSVTSEVAAFQLQLGAASTFPKSGSTYYTRAAGAVSFILGAEIDGAGSSVVATNKNPVSFYKVKRGASGCPSSAAAGCLGSRAFTLQYDDVTGGHWEVDVPAIVWAP